MSTGCCPTCGGPMVRRTVRPFEVDLSRFEFVPENNVPISISRRHWVLLLDALNTAYPGGVSTPRLVDLLWGKENDGGPANAESGVQVIVSQLRRVIKPAGWTIGRRRFGPYFLERTNA